MPIHEFRQVFLRDADGAADVRASCRYAQWLATWPHGCHSQCLNLGNALTKVIMFIRHVSAIADTIRGFISDGVLMNV
jgi:hypothetical protein